jgi:2-polyprenyl-3-methyl-5-hydroxy-6-metoxy-1,4-benzoquinol methylase
MVTKGSDALAGAAIHEDWVAKYRTPEAQRFYEFAFDALVAELKPAPGAVILDAGCGTCAKSVLLAQRGFHVVATDFAPDALERAVPTIEAYGVRDRITLRQGDLLKLPFKDGEFQYAICWGVLMHIPNVDQALAELARVVGPGGKLVLSEGNMHAWQSYALRAAKKVLGKGRGRVERVPLGLETSEKTAEGTLLTRQTDMPALVARLRTLGMELRTRRAGQFSELYTLAPKPLRRVIHAFNRVWFHHVRAAGPAFGNLLIFEKRG